MPSVGILFPLVAKGTVVGGMLASDERVRGEGGCAFILYLCTRFEPGDTKV
jgi:hypothetical protein